MATFQDKNAGLNKHLNVITTQIIGISDEIVLPSDNDILWLNADNSSNLIIASDLNIVQIKNKTNFGNLRKVQIFNLNRGIFTTTGNYYPVGPTQIWGGCINQNGLTYLTVGSPLINIPYGFTRNGISPTISGELKITTYHSIACDGLGQLIIMTSNSTATGDAYYSTTSGTIWSKINNSIFTGKVCRNCAMSLDGMKWVISFDTSISVSIDKGSTWTQINGVNLLNPRISNDGNVLAGYSGNTIYINTSGDNWSTGWYTITINSILSFNMSTDGRNMIVGTTSALFISNDFGVTWKQNTTIPTAVRYINCAISDDGQSIMVVWGLSLSPNNHSVSRDYGITWTHYTSGNGLSGDPSATYGNPIIAWCTTSGNRFVFFYARNLTFYDSPIPDIKGGSLTYDDRKISIINNGLSGIIPSITNQFTIVGLFKLNLFNFNSYLLAFGNRFATNDIADPNKFAIIYSNGLKLYRNNQALNIDVSYNETLILTSYYDGSNIYFGKNGSYNSMSSSGLLNINKLCLGINSYNNGNYNHSTDIFELLVYSSKLENKDIQTIEGYLAWKYGLQNNLPLNHLYKFNSIFYYPNYYLGRIETANIFTRPFNIYPTGISKIYNKNFIAQFTYTISGTLSGDILNISDYYANFNDLNAGLNRLITISNILSTNNNYNILSYAYTTANINPAQIFLNANALSKTYDGTVFTTFIYTISGFILNDTGDISGYYSNFYYPYTGFNIPVTISNILSTNSNYNINYSLITTANIYPKTLIITPLDKIYDQSISGYLTLSGIITSDIVIYNASYSDFNAGFNKTISASLITEQISLNSDPNLKVYLTFDRLTAYYNYFMNIANNQLDAICLSGSIQTSAYNLLSTNNPQIGTNVLGLNLTKRYSVNLNSNINVDTSSGLTICFWASSTLSGWVPYVYIYGSNYLVLGIFGNNNFMQFNTYYATSRRYDISNYDIGISTSILKHVTWVLNSDSSWIIYINGIQKGTTLINEFYPSNITLSGISFGTSLYGVLNPITANFFLTGRIDDFRLYNRSLTSTEIFTIYNYNSNKLWNNSNNNYTLNAYILYSAILPKPININPIGIDKIYDKSLIAQFTYTISGILTNDSIDISGYYANFNDFNIGTNKVITISNILSTNNNYEILSYAYTTANIFTKPININPIGVDKIYDKNIIAQFIYTISGILTDDIVDISNYYARFSDFNADINKLITISNIIINNNNYNISSYAYTIANIFTKPININPIGINKIYDKSIDAQFTYTISGILTDDIVDISNYYANFNDFNTGSNKLITISNIVITNNNYEILSYAYTFGDILPKPININPIGIDKIYDKSLIAKFIYTISGVIINDIVDISGYYANFNDFNTGFNKLITISDVVITNNNYEILSYAYTTANIFTKPININPIGIDKIYDKNIIAQFIYTISGILTDDIVDISNYYARFSDFNAGINKLITISNIIINNNNYNISSYAYTSANIIKKFLYVTPYHKIYDKTTIIKVTVSGIISDDIINYSAVFDDLHAGLNKSVTIVLNNQYIPTIISFTSNTLNLSGQLYIASQSSSGNGKQAWNIFNNNLTDYWISSYFGDISSNYVQNSYDYITHNYIGGGNDNYFTTIIDSSSYDGEWLQIQFPFSFILKSYTLYEKESPFSIFYIAGSNDGINWYLVDIQNIEIIPKEKLTTYFTSSTSYFSYFRLIINKLFYGSIAQLGQWCLYGDTGFNYQFFTNTINANIYPKTTNIIPSNINKTYDGTTNIYNLKLTISGIINTDIVTISSYLSYYNSSNTGLQLLTISYIIFGNIDKYNYILTDSINNYFGMINKKSLLIYYNPVKTYYNAYNFNLHSVSYNGFIIGENEYSLSGQLNYSILLDTTNDIRHVVDYNQVNYLICGNIKNSHTIGYSYDGNTWFNSNNNPFSSDCLNVETNNKLWVAVGSGSNTIAYSYDGINWTGIGISTFLLVGYGISYYNNKWIAVGQGINSIAISNDGINWTGLGTNIFSIYGKSIKTSKNICVAIGQGDNTMAYSYDGYNWIGLGTSLFNLYGNDILFNGALWLALGKGSNNTMAYSYDGITWYGLGTDIFNDYASSGDWDGNKWLVVGSGNNTMAYSYDGIVWYGLGMTVFNDFGKTIIYDGNKWLASGNTNLVFVTSDNGFNWNNINNSLDITFAHFLKCKKTFILFEQSELIDFGNYFVKPIGYYSNNYKITFLGDYTIIQKAPLIIKPNTISKFFDGNNNYFLNLFYSGFKGSDTSNNLLGTITYNTNFNSTAGTYTVTISGFYSLNYNIIFNQGIINIFKAPLIIKANNFTKIYDTSSYTPTYTIIGTGIYDLNFTLSGKITFSGTYLNNKDVGIYTIIPSGVSSYNYDINFVSGTLQITKSPLMIIAKDDSRIYTNDISNYLFVYTREHYLINSNYNFNQTTNTIQSIINFNDYDRVWTLEGYDGPCELNFDFVDNNTIVGLSEINYKTNITNYMQYFLYFDTSSNVHIMENNYFNYITVNNNIGNYKIKFDGYNIIYYKNGNILKITNKNNRTKLYVNILIKNKNTRVFNVQFNNIKEYYYGGNGIIFNGFKGNDNYLSLSGFIIYGGTSQGAYNEGTYSIIPSGVSSNNYDITFIPGQLKIKKSKLTAPTLLPYNQLINKLLLNILFTTPNKYFDGNNSANVSYTINTYDGEVLDISNNFIATYNSINSGDTIITISNIILYGITSSYYFVESYYTISGFIYSKILTIFPSTYTKTYDSTTNAIISYTLSGVLFNDLSNVFITYTSFFNDSNVGINKQITLSNIIINNNNYFVPSYYYTIGSIIPITITFNPTILSKEYDGTTTAYFTYSLSGLIYDIIDISNTLITANYSDIEVGNDLSVTISNIVINNSNYTVQTYYYTMGTILQKVIIVNIYNKTYDKSTNVNYTISGIINNDPYILNISYNTNNVGNNLVFISLSGTTRYKLNSYVVNSIISPSIITFNPIIIDKEYDGTTNAYFTYSLSGLIYDVIDISNAIITANYNDINVDINKLVTISNIILNNLNYYILPYFYIFGSILPKTLIVNIFNKIYNKTTNVNYTISGIINNDTFIFNSYYNSPNVGDNLVFISLSGTTNYKLNFTVINSIIEPQPIIFNPTIISKEYDGTTTAYFTYSLSGLIYDIIDISNTLITANYSDIEVGNDLSVTISNIVINNSNYYMLSYLYTHGSILPKTIIVNIYNKTYDKSTNVNYTISGIINNDPYILNISYDTNNAGNNLVFISLSGTTRYKLNSTVVNSIINPQIITFNANVIDKDYDGTTTAYFTYSLSGLIYDVLDINNILISANYSDIEVGTNKLVTISNIVINSLNYYVLPYFYTFGSILPNIFVASGNYVKNTLNNKTIVDNTNLYTAYIFTSGSGNIFDITKKSTLRILCVAGGGGSASSGSGGGGAGGFLERSITISGPERLFITVGEGGNGERALGYGASGKNSSVIFATYSEFDIISIGGGGGVNGAYNTISGGSGGGAGRETTKLGGAGVPGQGNKGGNGTTNWASGAGGGGAGAPGTNAISNNGNTNLPNGGNGKFCSLSGYVRTIWFAGGGGGAQDSSNTSGGSAGNGGKGGGGGGSLKKAGTNTYTAGVGNSDSFYSSGNGNIGGLLPGFGAPNSGGGAGGGMVSSGGGVGGSGVVIIVVDKV